MGGGTVGRVPSPACISESSLSRRLVPVDCAVGPAQCNKAMSLSRGSTGMPFHFSFFVFFSLFFFDRTTSDVKEIA